MSTRFPDKDPAARVRVEFDFARLTSSVTGTPTIEATVAAGTDAAPEDILDGSPVISGAKVLQWVLGGLDGVMYALECVATGADGEILTLEALLPVIDRPKVSDATPRYLTQAQFEQRFGVRELQDLMSDGNDYGRAENDAAGIVDGYIAARYSLPLVSVPGMVLGWVGDIARYRLWDEQAPDEVRRRYEDAIAQLRDVASGKMALPGVGGSPAPTADKFNADGYSNTRVFTSSTLDCY